MEIRAVIWLTRAFHAVQAKPILHFRVESAGSGVRHCLPSTPQASETVAQPFLGHWPLGNLPLLLHT